MSHTPGPWTLPHFAKPDVNCECAYVLTDGYMGAIATVHASGENTDGSFSNGDNPLFYEAVSNAHLIAAAPDLLWALEQIVNELPFQRDWLAPEVEAAARAAVAKARGE